MDSLAVAQGIMSAWENRDLKAAAGLLADELVVTGPAPQALGRDAYMMFQAVHNEAFPDWKFNVKETRVEGDKVYVTFQISATQTGTYDVSKLGLPIPPIPPSGKFRYWPVEHMTMTVKDGKATHLEIQNEPTGGLIGTLQWLGVPLPAPA